MDLKDEKPTFIGFDYPLLSDFDKKVWCGCFLFHIRIDGFIIP